MRPWYVRRVEAFLKAPRPESLSRLTAEQIIGYVQKVSSVAQLADWQFRQLVDALQLLLVDLAQVPTGKVVDWGWWKAGGKGMEADHPAIARSQPPRASFLRARPSRARNGVSGPGDPGADHPATQYSIRTKQAYLDWGHRFLGLCGETPTETLGVEDVQRFLTHLAGRSQWRPCRFGWSFGLSAC